MGGLCLLLTERQAVDSPKAAGAPGLGGAHVASDDATIEAPKAVSGVRSGEGVPYPAD